MSLTDRAFMEMAINEARKCKSEDKRSNPMVGAVVVKDGKVIAKGYRGELSLGEHAEFTVLERKLKDEILTGVTLYTTLEALYHQESSKKTLCREIDRAKSCKSCHRYA